MYDEDLDNENIKSNRVPDRANKWYANDGKIIVTGSSNGQNLLSAAFVKTIFFLHMLTVV